MQAFNDLRGSVQLEGNINARLFAVMDANTPQSVEELRASLFFPLLPKLSSAHRRCSPMSVSHKLLE